MWWAVCPGVPRLFGLPGIRAMPFVRAGSLLYMHFDTAASLSAVRKEAILIETEKQRRWWFATHPEFSSSRTGHRGDLLDRMGRLPRENPAKEAFIREMAKAGWSRAKAEERWNVYGLNENIAQGVARAMAVHGAGGAAIAILRGTYRWAVGLGVAGSIGKSGGPGKWVEVPRGLQGLEHQSKMSGQPIIERDGKFYIKEYEAQWREIR